VSLSEDIRNMKLDKMVQQGGRCAFCGEKFNPGDKPELSHILPQRKYLLAKYGPEIIHHPDNMKLCHPGRCNSGVQISPEKRVLVEAHVEAIREKIRSEES